MKKVLALVAIAVLTCTVATAAVNPSTQNGTSRVTPPQTRANGTLGSLTLTATQTGSLQVRLDAGVTTAGGDGVPFTGTTTGGNHVTLNDQVGLYAQIYDSPWQGGCQSWTSNPGPNWCFGDWAYFNNSPTALNSFAASFTTTVPQPDDYQTFALALVGVTWPTTGFAWGFTSGSVSAAVVETIYIDIIPTPTPGGPTPTPNQSNVSPVPTLSTLGIAVMGILLAGIGLLVLRRRN